MTMSNNPDRQMRWCVKSSNPIANIFLYVCKDKHKHEHKHKRKDKHKSAKEKPMGNHFQ